MVTFVAHDRTKLLSFKERFPADPSALLTIWSPKPESGAVISGQSRGASSNQLHETVVRGTLSQFKEGEEIGRGDDHILMVFTQPAEAVKFCLLLRANLQALTEDTGRPVTDRFGIHMGELMSGAPGDSALDNGLLKQHIENSVRLAHLSAPKRILMSGPAFDVARQSFKKDDLKKEDAVKIAALSWMNYGPYALAGLEKPVEICEVAEAQNEPTAPPANSDHAHRQASDSDPTAWGWRPALGQAVPGTNFVLDERAADSRLGEVWAGKEERANQRRMFRFCVHTDWVRALKGKEDVLKSLKRVVENRNLVGIYAVSLDQPPFYLMTDYIEGKDLRTWSKELGGLTGVPLISRLELVAQVASGLQAAHEVGIVHRFINPARIIVAGSGATPKDIQARLTDFAIGHIGVPDEPMEPAGPVAVEPLPEGGPTAGGSPPPEIPQALRENPYLAPELLAGGEPTVKSDTYALGVVLSQVLLGNLSEVLLAARIKEIVGSLKREKLLPYFAETASERTVGAGNIAGELRAVIKVRETRLTERRAVTPKQVALSLAVASVLLCVGIVGQAHYGKQARLHKARLAALEAKANKANADENGTNVVVVVEPDPPSAGAPREEPPRASTEEASEDESAAVIVRGKSGGGGSIRPKSVLKEVESTGAQLFKFIGLPIIVVVVIGTVIQNFGPLISSWFRGHVDVKPTSGDPKD